MCFPPYALPFALQIATFSSKFWPFLNSNFFTAIAGACAGAFAGALMAQKIAERSKVREELIKEMHNTNASIMISFSVLNSLLNLKSQHVRDLKQKFDKHKEEFFAHHAQLKRGVKSEFNFQADYQTLTLQTLPLDILQKQIFEKMSLVGRALVLLPTIVGVIHSLNSSLEKRNELIEQFKTNQRLSIEQRLALYFGLPVNGSTDQNYPDSINAIYSYNDDGLYFSRMLCDDLVEYGNYVANKFTKLFGPPNFKIMKPTFDNDRLNQIMPDPENYEGWQSMFKQAPANPVHENFYRRAWKKIFSGKV